MPDSASRSVFGDLFKEVVVRIEKETQPRSEIIDVHSMIDRVLHIFNSVAKRERQFLERGRASLANVIARNRHRVEPRHFLRAKLNRVHDELHRRSRRIDPLFLSDVLLEDVVLDGAAYLLPIRALLLSDSKKHREDH